MRNRYLLIGGGALVLLVLLVAGMAFLLTPKQEGGPRLPGLTTSGPVQAEPGDTTVTLKWQPEQGAAGYFILRDGNSTPLNPAPITGTTYSDIGLSNGRVYTYTVVIADAERKPGKRLAELTIAPKSK